MDEQAVVLSLKDNVIRGLNRTGTRIWQLLDGQIPVDEIAGIISDEFGVGQRQAKEDVQDFVNRLAENGLLFHEITL